MPPPGLNLRKLLQEPFGPYPDYLILDPTFGTKTIDQPSLSSVSFHVKPSNKPTGLDEIEVLTRAREGSVATKDIHFYGVLRIKHLNWLSEQGRSWLEMDFRERDSDINGVESGLTLANLYGSVRNEGSTIKVVLECKKALPATYLIDLKAGGQFRALRIESPVRSDSKEQSDQFRTYIIKSVDAFTFSMSRKYLARWRLYALIREIIDDDKKKTTDHRTIDWLIDKYLSQNNLSRQGFQSCIRLGKLDLPLHHRHISRNEVKGLFAEHAEWLLAQQLSSSSPRNQLLNIHKLIDFCRKVRQHRKYAKQSNSSWGNCDIDGLEYKTDQDIFGLTRFGEDYNYWRRKLKSVQQPSKKKPKRHESPVAEEHLPPPAPKFIYDPDFSEASTSAESESEDDIDTRLLLRIPWFVRQAPQTLLTGTLTWKCQHCGYSVDLLNLTNENLEGLPRRTVTELKMKQWISGNNSFIQETLQHMVSTHYRKSHLNGLDIVQENGKLKAVEADQRRQVEVAPVEMAINRRPQRIRKPTSRLSGA